MEPLSHEKLHYWETQGNITEESIFTSTVLQWKQTFENHMHISKLAGQVNHNQILMINEKMYSFGIKENKFFWNPEKPVFFMMP